MVKLDNFNEIQCKFTKKIHEKHYFTGVGKETKI